MPELSVHPENCAHQRVTHSHCDACVKACPSKAWTLHDDGLNFDSDRCDSCGLCVVVCPHQALALPAPIPIIVQDRTREALIACERASQKLANDDSTRLDRTTSGVVPCLHALTPFLILQWIKKYRVSAIRLTSGDCASCARYPQKTIQTQWALVASRLIDKGQTLPKLVPTALTTWQALANSTVSPDPRRRRFLGHLFPSLPSLPIDNASTSVDTEELNSGRKQLVRALSDMTDAQKVYPFRPLWTVVLDSSKCNWCMACFSLCPQNALRIAPIQDQDQELVKLDLHLCTGCGLCQDVCDTHALQVFEPDLTMPTVATSFLLEIKSCKSCKIDYRVVFRNSTNITNTSAHQGLCPTCQRGRPLHRQRVIQPDIENDTKGSPYQAKITGIDV